ncbi:MAG: HD domain-containing protein [Bacteroidales bacterium]|nr:HD domain-containing protein [Lachnoclostridium sp.]MCM1384732.1 HD domain-containing protein [Lachnoclostridium sp.]MCM1465254.1 HD domain-containing protein [Bacteroidales bacterium]
MKTDKFRDPIHAFIEVRQHELEIINTKAFQRLRNIKQLALTYLVYPGAEHTRFGHSLGVMHLVTRAFRSAIEGYESEFPEPKREQYEQILRLIALTHDIGHAPFSHASESVFPSGVQHEDFTVKIVKETEIADIINKIGAEFVEKYGSDYNITPELICNIYTGTESGPDSEYTFLKSFMDSELDCDKMDYLLRDSYYCGVKYGMYDVERLISSFTICYASNIPRLAIEDGGIQVFEEFVLARYFMFIQVYFHRTRRYFDIMLGKALEAVLPNGTYPDSTAEYLEWDDCRVIQLLKENTAKNVACKNIIERYVYPRVFRTKVHPLESDIREFRRNVRELNREVGEDNLLIDKSAEKMPHKIPKRIEPDNEKAIIIYDKDTERKTTISEESEIIRNLTEKMDIMRIYCHPDKAAEARELMKSVNQ